MMGKQKRRTAKKVCHNNTEKTTGMETSEADISSGSESDTLTDPSRQTLLHSPGGTGYPSDTSVEMCPPLERVPLTDTRTDINACLDAECGDYNMSAPFLEVDRHKHRITRSLSTHNAQAIIFPSNPAIPSPNAPSMDRLVIQCGVAIQTHTLPPTIVIGVQQGIA